MPFVRRATSMFQAALALELGTNPPIYSEPSLGHSCVLRRALASDTFPIVFPRKVAYL